MPPPESPKSYFHFTAVEAFVANEDNFVKIMTFTSIYAIKSVSDQVLIGNSLIHQFLPVNAPHLTPSQKASIKEMVQSHAIIMILHTMGMLWEKFQ